MSATRNCPSVPLSKKPLALVLIQVRYSPIAKIADFIPEIQDMFRKNGYPVQTNPKIVTFEVGPEGIKQTETAQWRFETPGKETVVLIDQGQILLQTTKYTSFELFFTEYLKLVSLVMAITEHDEYGICTRLGLRYVDQIRKQTADDTIESYLRPELRGMECSEYADSRKQYTLSTIGKTMLSPETNGTLAIRIIRGERGLDLPPDLLAAAPAGRTTVSPDEDIALIDMDHYWDGSLGPGFDEKRMEELFYRLHDTIIRGFHRSVVSEEGIAKWK
ncbi:MAG TPA: TIGR04255 family protein [Treponemataceae bacterium]|nr:TIGR04255 family protein [Treponemataceae bacterium]